MSCNHHSFFFIKTMFYWEDFFTISAFFLGLQASGSSKSFGSEGFLFIEGGLYMPRSENKLKI